MSERLTEDSLEILIWDLRELAFEGFSRGWDGLDQADKHTEIGRVIDGIKAELRSLRSLRERALTVVHGNDDGTTTRVYLTAQEVEDLRYVRAFIWQVHDEYNASRTKSLTDILDKLTKAQT